MISRLSSGRLSENRMALFNILSTVLIAGINFITIPIFTRMLDTDGFGIVSVYVTWVNICSIFIGLKADGSISAASVHIDESEQDSYQLSILLMSTITFSVLFVLSQLLMDLLVDLLNMSSILVNCMLLQGYGAFLISFFNARFIFRKQAQYNFAISVGLCIGTTALSIILISHVFSGQNAYMGRVLGLTIPNLILGISLYVALAVKQGNRLNLSYWHFCLSLTLPLIFHSLSQLVLSQSDRVIIQRLQGDSLAGIYSIAATVINLLNAITNALNNAFVPFMFEDLAGKTSEEVKQSHFKNYLHLYTLGTCAFALMCPEVLKLMSTESYWSAIEILPLLVIGQYCSFLYSFPVNYEFYKMKTNSIAVGTAFAAVLNMLLNSVFIPLWGMHGAALATMIAYFCLFCFHFYIARYRLYDRNYPVRYMGIGLCAVIISSVSFYPLANCVLLRWIIGFLLVGVALKRVLRSKSIF